MESLNTINEVKVIEKYFMIFFISFFIYYIYMYIHIYTFFF